MNTSSITKSAATLALSALLAAGSAQACPPGGGFPSPAAACAGTQGDNTRSCPTGGISDRENAACPTPKEDLWTAVGTLAAGGMEIATNVMRAVRDGLGGESARNPGR